MIGQQHAREQDSKVKGLPAAPGWQEPLFYFDACHRGRIMGVSILSNIQGPQAEESQHNGTLAVVVEIC